MRGSRDACLLAQQHGPRLDAVAFAHRDLDDALVRLGDQFEPVALDRAVDLDGPLVAAAGQYQRADGQHDDEL